MGVHRSRNGAGRLRTGYGQARSRYEGLDPDPGAKTILHDARKKPVEAVKKDDVMCNKVMTAALTRAGLKMYACVHKPLAPIGASAWPETIRTVGGWPHRSKF
jgi:hypothetical protein